MQHKTTLRVSDSRPNGEQLRQIQNFLQPAGAKLKRVNWDPVSFFLRKKRAKTLLKSPSAESRKFGFMALTRGEQPQHITY